MVGTGDYRARLTFGDRELTLVETEAIRGAVVLLSQGMGQRNEPHKCPYVRVAPLAGCYVRAGPRSASMGFLRPC